MNEWSKFHGGARILLLTCVQSAVNGGNYVSLVGRLFVGYTQHRDWATPFGVFIHCLNLLDFTHSQLCTCK